MGDVFKGDAKAPNEGAQAADKIRALTRNLPAYLQMIRGEIGPTEEALFRSRQQLSPQEAALNAQLYQTYAPLYAQTESQVDLERLLGLGGAAARQAASLQREIDPEFFRTRELIAAKLGDLINNPLSKGEESAIERGNLRERLNSGTYNTPSNLSTVRGLVNYGDASRNRLGQALSLATQALPQFKSGIDTYAQATGRTGTQGIQTNLTGQNQGQGSQQLFGTINNESGLFGQNQQNNANINANRRTVYDAVNQSYGSATSICCFVFLESYNGRLPWWIRKLRDDYYETEPEIAVGYKRFARFIVPLMRRFGTIRELVNDTLVMPLSCFGGYLCGVKGYADGAKYEGYKKFWFRVWKLIGKI